MVEAARAADSADRYDVAPTQSLPYVDGEFDLVIAYNVLMDVDDVPAALREARRVLKPDGTLFISIVHPFRDRGRFTGPQADAPFVIDGTYYGREHFDGKETRDGLSMHFAGWSLPLQDYMAALEAAGLAIVSLREPQPDAAPTTQLQQWTRLPMFLWIKAKPMAGGRRRLARQPGDAEAGRQFMPFQVRQGNPAGVARIVARDRFAGLPAAQHGDQDEVAAQGAGFVAVEDVYRIEHMQRLGDHAGFFQ
ncbi:hypothetical protein G6F65_017968 [Rhizopus arrhizus]|nr:hypothetical protein G6F65_017968 [Rhizopus arrhizus]